MLDQPLGEAVDLVAALGAGAPEGLAADPLQDRVHRHVEVGHGALADPVVGHVAQPAPLALADPEPGHVLAEQRHLAGARAALAGDQLGQLALAVAVDARDPDDLARPHLEPDVAQRDRVVVAVERQPADRERDLAELTLRPLAPRRRRLDLDRVGELGRLLAEHHLDDPAESSCSARPLSSCGARAPTTRPARSTDPVAELDRLVQLVGDQDHRQPLGLQVSSTLRSSS